MHKPPNMEAISISYIGKSTAVQVLAWHGSVTVIPEVLKYKYINIW